MSEDVVYRDLVAQLRREIRREFASGADLPALFRPENQDVSEGLAARIAQLKPVLFSGGRPRASECELAGAGLDRSRAEAEHIPELDEARERVKKRLKKGQDADLDNEGH